MKYFVAKNTGKGFITHEDTQLSRITEYPGDVWVTGDINVDWGARVGAREVSKQSAQILVNTAIRGVLYPPDSPLANQQIMITLP